MVPEVVFAIFFNLLFPLSLLMLGVVLIQWRRRVTQGFRFGQNVPVLSWENIDVGQLIVILLFVWLQLSIAAFLLKRYGQLGSDNRQALYTVVSQILLYSLLLFLVQHLLRRMHISWSDAFGLRLHTLPHSFFVAFCVLIAIFVPIGMSSTFTQRILEHFHYPVDQQTIFGLLVRVQSLVLKSALIVLAVIGAPVTEEIIFRGIIYGWLKKRVGFSSAVWMNSLIFGLIHLHLPSALPLFVLAIGFTLVYEWTGNLGANMFMHASFNAFSLLFFWLRNQSP